MKSIARKPIFLAVLTSLAACGGGGGSTGDDSGNLPDVVPGTNGLNYGAIGQELSEAAGETVTMRTVSFESPTVENEDVSVTFGADFFNGDLDATAELFGETVTISDGVGTLSNGQTVSLFFEEGQSGTYAGILSLVSYGSLETPVPMNAIDGEARSVFGFETNPDTIDARVSGEATYEGGFAANGAVFDGTGTLLSDFGEEFEGTITITVRFGDMEADGTLDGTYEIDAQTVNVSLDFVDAAIVENDIIADFECAGGVGCSSSTSMEATFYGPGGEEIGGTLAVDTEQEVSGNDRQFVGAGAFVIEPTE